MLSFNELLERMKAGWEWTAIDLRPYAERARSLAAKIQVILHFTIHDDMSDTQIIHQLLSQLGLKFEFRWSRAVAGYEGQKLKVFHLVVEVWQRLWSVLERRQSRRPVREESEEGGSPLPFNDSKLGGDRIPPDLEPWFAPECLADVRQMWESSQSDFEKLAELRRQVPGAVLRHLGLAS